MYIFAWMYICIFYMLFPLWTQSTSPSPLWNKKGNSQYTVQSSCCCSQALILQSSHLSNHKQSIPPWETTTELIQKSTLSGSFFVCLFCHMSTFFIFEVSHPLDNDGLGAQEQAVHGKTHVPLASFVQAHGLLLKERSTNKLQT